MHISADLLELYLLNRVPEAELDALDEHLMVCHSCLDRAEQAQSELLLLKQVLANTAVSHRKEAKLPALARIIIKTPLRLTRQPVSLWVTLAAAGVLLACAGAYGGRKRNPAGGATSAYGRHVVESADPVKAFLARDFHS
jgi:hypothetical protein